MAARTITMDELGVAVKEYAARHELTVSSNEKGFCLMPGDVVIALQDGKPSCSNAEILDSLIEILMDLAEEPARAPQKPNLPARPTKHQDQRQIFEWWASSEGGSSRQGSPGGRTDLRGYQELSLSGGKRQGHFHVPEIVSGEKFKSFLWRGILNPL